MNKLFCRNDDGNVAIMTSIMLIVIVVFAGIAVDSGRVQTLRSEAREAADAALLAAVRAKINDDSLSEADMTAIANRIFLANSSGSINLKSLSVQPVGTDGSYELAVEGSARTFLLNIIGIEELDVNASPVVTAAAPSNIELALVLDNTTSMAGSRMDALRLASRDLVDQIVTDGDDRVRVSIVPFGQHVNVGIANGSESWISVPPDDTETINECNYDYPANQAQGCSVYQSTCPGLDGSPAPCTIVDCPVGITPITVCGNVSYDRTWYGCVGSREAPLNIEDTDYNKEPVPGVLNWLDTYSNGGRNCPSEITPLTSTKSELVDAIADLTTIGETYVPGGLSWGYRALTEIAPFTEGKSAQDVKNQLGKKVLVLMTDGTNTVSPDYFWQSGQLVGWHSGSDRALADTNTALLCDEIKGDDIEVFTVAFEVTEQATLDMLKDCATSSSRFFDASDSGEFIDAFQAIGQSISELRLAR